MSSTIIYAIDLRDCYTLVAVWELNDENWQLLQLDRLKRAIALCNEESSKRTVLPIGITPKGLCGGKYKERSYMEREANSANPLSNKLQQLLETINLYPGLSSRRLANKLGTTEAAVRQLLQKLKHTGKVNYRPDPIDGRQKLYYSTESFQHN